MRYKIENKHYDYFVGSYSHGLGRTSHIHTHLEMVYLLQGTADAIVDGKRYALEPGDLFVAFPNQIHFYENKERPVKHYLMIFSSGMDMYLKKLLEDKVPACPVIKAARLPADTEKQLQTIAGERMGKEFEKLSAKGRFLHFLGQVLPLLEYVPSDCAVDHDSVRDVLAYCMEHFTEPISLESIAKELHLSKYYISHIFKERTNMSFTRFVGGLRVERACELLQKKDMNITEAAYGAGFSSIRTFNRVFAEETGMSPREYIARHR